MTSRVRGLVAAGVCLCLWVSPALAQQPGQRTFASPEEAGEVLFDATQRQDLKALLSIFGPEGKIVISSGDADEDFDSRIRFVDKYQQMHRFASDADGKVTLFVGAENWPLPIPLVDNHGAWYFDTAAGKDEILFRRVGKNELAAMDACAQLVFAQKEYFAHPQDGAPAQFAQKLVSDEGRHNGLYWDGADNQFDSPINPLIAFAYGKGPNDSDGDQLPFNGYFFRILTSQGSHASGGARSYVSNRRMTSGFAFVAYPAEYRASGVMTFLVDCVRGQTLSGETAIQ